MGAAHDRHAHPHADAHAGADAHDDVTDDLDPDEPHTPMWLPLLGGALFLLALMLVLATDTDDVSEDALGDEPAAAEQEPGAAEPEPGAAEPEGEARQPSPEPPHPAGDHRGHGH